ncbi:o-succinylbenzoate synthase [Clostridium acetobutylicum]|uniref:L-Ala-D/L-Glu epimerase n=1 Tax=Clostridium acetobutylicum (strain ATCC 824 / DSM 792 / JCM 1419 / IAM 19013 / LMG 5710 / NBRC 13948 / NRRL B-527 / VKM B-1787 / 2291 / W) TaxID=272562 RepID=AEEP_CLOAB|nr:MULTISPECIES: dipeptide epimerase [Clostridium]Q97MK4.1 RecName: Full=L-Ala-D/L-Glu epimerase; Short=AE epimerase; Short=AEE [Clostridium acetobutylicum ATCC 824]AAK78174.1 Similar to chloromuconate cycloisomerase [Clostridium acetobutylicum ATCC 824]ADZ19238.1 Chloromuconate cycloisomerase [Clostridium acetobutylicum EA 2018]AEI33737.1 putative chloromuconate cycloisomerase [Clostridium acetobutylicum DSM 1731]AWV81981.1 dipeptide epimerase [Clostridium acetobutylicum]MBC2395950.1 dipepti
MIIKDIVIGHLSVPLKKPFKTAVRSVNSVNDVVVKIITDTGNVGFGSAASTGLVTGDITESIEGAINNYIKRSIVGMDIEDFEAILIKLDNCIVGNTSAKAAVDIALYDLYGQRYGAPLYKLLGGFRNKLETDITISVNSPEEMSRDSVDAVKLGYKTLKIKVGKNPKLDIKRMREIRKAIGYEVNLRIDANQGWQPKEAIRALNEIENEGLKIELVEQPVKAWNLEGLKMVTDNVNIPVMADESVFSPKDAARVMEMRACDLINIKLMKTGGIHNALKICALAEVYGMECMLGCMLEGKVSVTAAVHLAAAKRIITKIDLDGPVLCSRDDVVGGAMYDNSNIVLVDEPGLGIEGINN